MEVGRVAHLVVLFYPSCSYFGGGVCSPLSGGVVFVFSRLSIYPSCTAKLFLMKDNIQKKKKKVNNLISYYCFRYPRYNIEYVEELFQKRLDAC